MSNNYVLFGFPASKTKRSIKSYDPFIKEKRFNIKGYCQFEYLRNNVPETLITQGFSDHLFFSKINKGADMNFNGRIIKPQQNGLSGCGLWEVKVGLLEGEPELKLVGIFTEYQMGFGISVKLKYAIDLIRRKFC